MTEAKCLCGVDRTLTKSGIYVCDNCDTVQESEYTGERIATKRDYAFNLMMERRKDGWYDRV